MRNRSPVAISSSINRRVLPELTLHYNLQQSPSAFITTRYQLYDTVSFCHVPYIQQIQEQNTPTMCHIEETLHANCTRPVRNYRRHNPFPTIDETRLGPFLDSRDGWVPCQLVLYNRRTRDQCLASHPQGFPIIYTEEDIDCKECNYIIRELNHWVSYESGVRVKADPVAKVWHQVREEYKTLIVPCLPCVNGKVGRLLGEEPKSPPVFQRVTPRTKEPAASPPQPPQSWGPFFFD